MSQFRDPWAVSLSDVSPNATLRTQLELAMRFAILAPSTHNTQPWRFQRVARGIDLYADYDRALGVIDRTGRQLVMSCGGALYNLRVALTALGHRVRVRVLPYPEHPALLAQVRIVGELTPGPPERDLCSAMTMRRTNRQAFLARPVSGAISDGLIAVAAAEQAVLTRLTPIAKHACASLIAEADRAQFHDRKFRRELARWLTPLGSRRGDGIPFVKKEYGSLVPLAITLRVRTFDIGDEVASREQELARRSPALLILSTVGDETVDWVRAGQAMQAVLLEGERLGLSASFLNQALELDDIRARVAGMLGRQTHPQLILRMGYGPPVVRPTPRRALADVVVE